MTVSQAQLNTSAINARNWLLQHLTAEGSYGREVEDLAYYYKSPTLFLKTGKPDAADSVLSFIKKRFMQPNGDFLTAPSKKSNNTLFEDYSAYANGWIAMGAHSTARFDISFSAYKYLKTYLHPDLGGCTLTKPYQPNGDNTVDSLSTAQLGLVYLVFGDISNAKRAGDLLIKCLSLQPEPKSTLYLRMNNDGKLLTTFQDEQAFFCAISANQPHQAYFMIGHPAAFLGKLYQATNETQYLDAAKRYLDFALLCDESIYSFHYAHKIAWSAAIIGELSGEHKYKKLSDYIGQYLLDSQDSEGMWLKQESDINQFDQTAELGVWLSDIAMIKGRGSVDSTEVGQRAV